MTEYVKATANSAPGKSFKFTGGRKYKILCRMGDYVTIADDNGNRCNVPVGEDTIRLEGSGRFERAIDTNDAMLTEWLRKAERDRDQYERECIKAEAVINRLYDMFPHVRNHEQLISAIKSAKIFSDAFIELQKIK